MTPYRVFFSNSHIFVEQKIFTKAYARDYKTNFKTRIKNIVPTDTWDWNYQSKLK